MLGGPVFGGGYHLCKKKKIIRVIFQDQAMYTYTLFTGAKSYKIGNKCMYYPIFTNIWKINDVQMKKKHTKHVLRAKFHTCIIHA